MDISTLGSCMFENDVKTYGIQTMMTGNITNMTFENDVKMHGIQTQSGQ